MNRILLTDQELTDTRTAVTDTMYESERTAHCQLQDGDVDGYEIDRDRAARLRAIAIKIGARLSPSRAA